MLWQAGVLSKREVAAVMHHWRGRFEQSHEWRFIKYPTEADRQAHFKQFGIPAVLIRKWTAERRRRAKIIAKLETAS